jgi:hypothetical protein
LIALNGFCMFVSEEDPEHNFQVIMGVPPKHLVEF